jgi:glycosyltransferase involved in cell wall biosynthesis
MTSTRLTIGVDARAAAEVPAGRGRYVRELVRELGALDAEVDVVLYGRRPWPLPGSSWRLVATPDPLWPVHAGIAAARRCDAVLAANSFLMAAAAGARSVAIVHDLFGFDRRFGAPAGGAGERLSLPLAARRAGGFVCDSNATRDDLVERFPRLAGRTAVVPLGVHPRFTGAAPGDVPARHGLDAPYVLAVGTREPRKNLPRLVRAFAGLPEGLRERHRLAIAGSPGWDDAEAERLASSHRQVVLLGFVEDDDLPALYAGATAVALPSLAEGFGLPVIEAMAAGTPVLTSNRSALLEVADGAAQLVDPLDVESIRAGLAELLEDAALRERLARQGRERAAQFTWRRTARETLDYLTSVTSTFAAGNSRDRKVSS